MQLYDVRFLIGIFNGYKCIDINYIILFLIIKYWYVICCIYIVIIYFYIESKNKGGVNSMFYSSLFVPTLFIMSVFLCLKQSDSFFRFSLTFSDRI